MKNKKVLTRQRILKEAVRHADKHGIESVNMRTLAGLLDAGVMSIYHHVANKDDLLDAMVEFVAAKIIVPDAGQPWRQAITQVAVSAHQTFLKHAWVNSIWSKQKLGPAKLAHMEAILRVLREGGFSVPLACQAYHAITMHILGFTHQTIDFPIKPEDLNAAATEFLNGVDEPASIPYFVEHVHHHLEHPDLCDDFVFMLDMILDGFERLLAAPRPK